MEGKSMLMMFVIGILFSACLATAAMIYVEVSKGKVVSVNKGEVTEYYYEMGDNETPAEALAAQKAFMEANK